MEHWLLNFCVFPLFDTVLLWTRELSAAVGGLVLAILALVSFWQDGMPDRRLFTLGTLATMVVGMAAVALGVAVPFAPIMVVGASLVTVGAGLSNIYAGLACTCLGLRRAAPCVAGAYALSFALRWAVQALPSGVALGLFAAIPLVCVACAARPAHALFERELPESPALMSVTAPHAFLPFSHQVFVTLVVFRVVYGFTLVFGEVDRVPVSAPWAFVPLAALAIVALVPVAPSRVGKGRAQASSDGVRTPDLLFKLSILCSVAGFLFAGLSDGGHGAPAQTLLATGTGFFEVLLTYTLVALGTKNPAGALPALAWGNAMASWGTIVGATLGRAANAAGGQGLGTITALVVLGMVAYVLFALPRLSFSATIEGVLEASDPVPNSEVDVAAAGLGAADGIDAHCARIAEMCGLTERELEVLRLLARGRNARFIQDELAITYSTTKTHVGRIYRKTGVHTHQELIDLVEKVEG